MTLELRSIWTLTIAAASVCGCDVNSRTAVNPVTISYETRGCYGTCPDFSVFVFRNSTGTFIGRKNTAFVGERRFRLEGEEFERLSSLLAPIKPKRGSIPANVGTECNAGDGPSQTISWVGADDSTQSFCLGTHDEADPQLARLAGEKMTDFIESLPIKKLISARSD